VDEAESPHPSFLKRLRQMFSRRIITQSEDLEREIQHIIDEGEERGLITRQEGQLIESIFEFKDTLVREIMVPRLEMVGVERHTPLDQIIALVRQCGHSRFPVFEGDIDHIKGILLAKDLLVFWQTPEETWDLDRVLRPAYFIPESKKISDLLRDLVERKSQIAIVIDEYGEVQGIVTLQDLIEAITGEFSPRDPETSWAVQRDDGSWLLDGHIPVPELKDRLALDTVPDEERGRYHTLSGLMMLLTGRLPKEGDKVEWEQWRFEIVDMDGRTIDKVLATRMDPSAPESTDESANP